jgi:hypothetical protein
MAWPTAKDIVNDAGIEIGLLDADLSDPYASTDQAVVQLCRLLKKAGREIVREREWSHLTREHTFTTVALQKAYALPTDFRAMIPQTGWDRSSTQPLIGPIPPQEWQCVKGSEYTYQGYVLFRPAEGQLWLLEDALAGDLTIAFEYRTNWWACATGGTAPTKEAPEASTDIVFLDAYLATCKLALEWKKAKSLDTTSAQQDYDDAYAKAAAADGSGRPLSLGGPCPRTVLISEFNLPPGGRYAL